MHPAQRLRQTLSEGSLIVAPGAYDCLSAKAVQAAGFPAIYMTGMGTSACRLGLPDYGLATMSEMVSNAAAMTFAVETPIIADADTGYGNELNMTRTVREYERQGVAGIHIEDQVFPKKCGHLESKSVIGHDAYISKIRAAVDARSNPDFIIIARTDANGVLGFDAAIRRANSALDAGADLALVEAPTSIEQLRAVPERVNGPCVLNVLIGGKSPLLSLEQIEEFGYRMVLLSDALLGTAMAAYDAALHSVLTAKGPLHLPDITSPREVFQRLGSDDWDNLKVHTAKEEEKSLT